MELDCIFAEVLRLQQEIQAVKEQRRTLRAKKERLHKQLRTVEERWAFMVRDEICNIEELEMNELLGNLNTAVDPLDPNAVEAGMWLAGDSSARIDEALLRSG